MHTFFSLFVYSMKDAFLCACTHGGVCTINKRHAADVQRKKTEIGRAHGGMQTCVIRLKIEKKILFLEKVSLAFCSTPPDSPLQTRLGSYLFSTFMYLFIFCRLFARELGWESFDKPFLVQYPNRAFVPEAFALSASSFLTPFSPHFRRKYSKFPSQLPPVLRPESTRLRGVLYSCEAASICFFFFFFFLKFFFLHCHERDLYSKLHIFLGYSSKSNLL